MSHTDEGPNIKARAKSLVSQVFMAQLDILQSFLPLNAWLVGYDDGNRFSVVATTGLFGECNNKDLAHITQGKWQQITACTGIYYRPITAIEHELFDAPLAIQQGSDQDVACTDGKTGPSLVRIALDTSDSAIAAYVVGLASHWPCPQLLESMDKVMQCLKAMGLIATLYTELSAASRRVTEMQRDAYIDPLTAVLNRAGWNQRLAQVQAICRAAGTDAAIIMLDLDFLKEVNDSQGHSAGDDLLRLTAQTISSVLRGGDSVARLGGDEFGIVIKNASAEGVDILLSRLKEAFDKVKVRISMGLALSSEGHGQLSQAIKIADGRMYDHKRSKPVAEILPIDWMLGKNYAA